MVPKYFHHRDSPLSLSLQSTVYNPSWLLRVVQMQGQLNILIVHHVVGIRMVFPQLGDVIYVTLVIQLARSTDRLPSLFYT
jgi:hypothetical protein